jgi:hypothetical protein
MMFLHYQIIQPWPRSRVTERGKPRNQKAKACLFAAISTTIFKRIMSLKLAKRCLGLSEEGICRG